MTDPVDTDALREAVWRHGRRATVVTVDREMLESAADEVDRLRAVIDNAPHAYECFADFTPGSNCTCWKADAL